MRPLADIDLGRLEEEWLLQPKLYEQHADQMADAKLDLAEAEAQLEAVEARVKLRIRKVPHKYGVKGRPTNDAVKELLILSPKYQEALTEVNKRKHRVDSLQGVINTLEHRKRALEGLVQLHGQSYFSKPKLHDSVKSGLRNRIEGASLNRGSGMKKRKNKKDDI